MVIFVMEKNKIVIVDWYYVNEWKIKLYVVFFEMICIGIFIVVNILVY